VHGSSLVKNITSFAFSGDDIFAGTAFGFSVQQTREKTGHFLEKNGRRQAL